MTFSHTVPTMVGFFANSEALLNALPAEFTKSEFEAIRKTIGGHPISMVSARKYGIVEVIRTEPATYTKIETRWENPVTGELLDYDQMWDKWSEELARQFGIPYTACRPWFYRDIPNREVEVSYPCERNIFRVNVEKFKAFA